MSNLPNAKYQIYQMSNLPYANIKYTKYQTYQMSNLPNAKYLQISNIKSTKY